MTRLALCLLTAAIAFAQEPVFKVDVKLVRMLVTVKDTDGQLVGSLNKTDFSIADNSVSQDLILFERQTEQPLSVAVLVDTSASTGKDLHYELDSVARFLKALVREGNSLDAASLYSFNWQVNLESSYTRRLLRLEQALKQLHSEGGTSLYDALFLAGRDLEYRDGRHVIVVVTDGGDTTSTKSYHQALEGVQLADASVYPIVVVPITNDAGRNTGGEHALATIAASTGGRTFAPTVGEQLDQAFAEILRDLRTQYLLGFYPKNVPLVKERFHRLSVTLRKPGLRVLTRTGYYGEAVSK